jgi:DNA-binding protein Fis
LLPKELVKGAYAAKKDMFMLPEEGINLEQIEESFVKQALELSKGNQTHAAKLLGLSRHALIYRLEKYKLK